MSSGAPAVASKSTASFEPGFILKALYLPRARTVGVTPEGGDAIAVEATMVNPRIKLSAALVTMLLLKALIGWAPFKVLRGDVRNAALRPFCRNPLGQTLQYEVECRRVTVGQPGAECQPVAAIVRGRTPSDASNRNHSVQ
jgi:hypothetical protein